MQVTGCVKEGHLLEICGWYRNTISLGVLLNFNKYPTCDTLETKTQQRNTQCLDMTFKIWRIYRQPAMPQTYQENVCYGTGAM